MEKLIYIADDDKNIRELLQTFLESDGYEVRSFSTGDELLAEFSRYPSDLVILDVMIPGKDGLTCCKELRSISNIPIIILTAKDTELDYIQGMTIGSDDYITKPFRPTILLMKIKALLRRIEMDDKGSTERLIYGDLCYEPLKRILYCKKKQLELTKLEQQVITYMMNMPEKVYSREEFLEKVWGYNEAVESRVVDEMLRRVRKKLVSAKSIVTVSTVWGHGYQLKVMETYDEKN